MLDIYCFYELGNLPRMIDLFGALPKKITTPGRASA
jgi:hypothetical protein